MEAIRLAFKAMATRFEIVILDDDRAHAQAAAEEAKREILRIEGQCSFYSASSELSRINREAPKGPTRCTAGMMRLLSACQELHRETEGYFDPTIAPALATWGLRHRDGEGSVPSRAEREALVSSVGFDAVQLDPGNRSVHFSGQARQLDLGGIAKGWALDEARILLEESGIAHALLHGGTSTAVGIGLDPAGLPWSIGVEDPYTLPKAGAAPAWIATIPLSNASLSVSGVHGKSFTDTSGESHIKYGHIVDPITGMATSGRRLSIVVAPSATASDAWSTALLTCPTLSLPENASGTALNKTDSGWTLAAGRTLPDWPFAEYIHPSS